MKIHFTISEAEAIELSKIKLTETVENMGDVDVEIQRPFPPSIADKEVARASKIQLIKFIRTFFDDLRNGRIELIHNPNQSILPDLPEKPNYFSLATAKTYVEKYFDIKP